MYEVPLEGKISMVNLFRQIIQQKPPLKVLNMEKFGFYWDKDEKISELVLEILLCSNINSITDLNLCGNPSWFQQLSDLDYERTGQIDDDILTVRKSGTEAPLIREETVGRRFGAGGITIPIVPSFPRKSNHVPPVPQTSKLSRHQLRRISSLPHLRHSSNQTQRESEKSYFNQ